MTLYETLAADIAALIARGVLRAGEKIPSVRQTSQHHKLSVTTVIRAYLLLESRGLLESRPQSGYFVRQPPGAAPASPASPPIVLSSKVDVSLLVLSTLRTIRTEGALPLGSPYPDPSLFPWTRINQYAHRIARRQGQWSVTDDLPPGNPELIRQIARRHLENGLAVDPASTGLVLHCASFSKSLTGAHRIGWALPGRYTTQVEKLKFLNTLTTPSTPQLAIAAYLQNDGYDFHLRKVRKAYAQQASIMAAAVKRFLPPHCKVSEPMGGYVLWVELPPAVDAMRLYALALRHKITVGPGNMFSVRNSFNHFIRLNYSYPWSAQVETAVRTLGRLVTELAGPV